MKVCVDIQSAMGRQRAGIGRYTRSLVERLGELSQSDCLLLFCFDFQRRGIPFPVKNSKQKIIKWCPGRLMRRCWNTLRWPPFDMLAGPADVYHFPNFIIPPLSRGRGIATIHDLSFMAYPRFAEDRNLTYLTALISDTASRADAIITDSTFSAAEISERLSVDMNRIFPIHLGISEKFAPASPEAVGRERRKLGLDRPYVLTVSTIEPRKNIEFLVRVFEQMTGFDGCLVVAGMKGWKYEPILKRMRDSSRARDIRHLEYVSDEELPALYSGAELFFFPSLYEGFGLPPLEAMACGTPVIASTSASLPEVLGDGALAISGFDAETWASEALRILSETSERQAMIERGLRQAARYTWRETARRTWEVYRKTAS